MRLSELLNDNARERPDAPCVVYQNEHEHEHPHVVEILTYGAAYRALQNHQRWLKEQVKVLTAKASHSSITEDDGDATFIVGYLASNSADFFLSVLACTDETVAALPALVNTRWTVTEIVAVLESKSSAAMTILLYGPGFAETAQQVADKLRVQHPASASVLCAPIPAFLRRTFVPAPTVYDDASSITTRVSSRALAEDEIDQRMDSLSTGSEGTRENAVLVYTSGTTSGSKGVRLSHAAVAIQAWAKLRHPCRYSATTAMLATTIPFFHVGGLSSISAVWLAGGTLVFPADNSKNGARVPVPGFSPPQVWRSIANGNGPSTNTLVVVPAMLHALEKNAPANIQPYPGVELVLIGGQSAGPSTLQFLSRVFPNAAVVQTYACTEAASSLTFLDVKNNPPTTLVNTELAGDCVGVPPKHIQLGLFRTDAFGSRFIVNNAPYTAGVIGTRGPHVMTGYWSRDKSNHTVIGYHEWMFTTDLGFWDDQGRLHFCGRVNDVIRTGGETVLALEVERVLVQHPDVVECAVFSLSDDKFGEAVCCALVCRDRDRELPVADIRRWCLERGLAGYKRPRRVFHVKELPRNSSGKILKFLLKEMFADKATLQSRL
jgi:acyl-CoA synthetase (AMP-forming)/AMP-acid ligase II